jgi:hypothetical protein
LVQIVLLIVAAGSAAQAQEVFRASWKIQDRSRGLEQQFARDIIERANDWLTSDDPNAPTARLDDPLRVTVIGEALPGGGRVRTRLRRLVLGSIAIDTGFTEFLDAVTIASLERRDHYWCDESVVVFNQALSPIPGSPDEIVADTSLLLFERAFSPDRTPRIKLGLNESSIVLAEDLYAWGGFGFEEIGLPDFSLGRARIGVAYDGLRIWAELPAPVGSLDNPFLARGYEGAYGVGLSFEEEWFGGAISGANTKEQIGSGASTEGARYFVSKAALAYGIVPIRLALFGDLPLRARLGLGYLEATPVPVPEDGAATTQGSPESGLKAFGRLEFASSADDGSQAFKGSLELFGSSLVASYQQQISPLLGVRISAATHGVFGGRDPFLPAYSITLSPIFSIW